MLGEQCMGEGSVFEALTMFGGINNLIVWEKIGGIILNFG